MKREAVTISVELAPKGEQCRLVTTQEVQDEIHLTVLHHDHGFVYFTLDELENQSNEIQNYIEPLIPKIKDGYYQMKLIDMTKEEICC